MSELTDLQICKKIAEIEGFEPIPYEHLQMSDKSKFVDLGDWTYLKNPLTDKALCFDLMVKYELDLQAPYRPHNETEWEVMYWIDGVADAGAVRNENPQKAICLAIIAKHNKE